MTATNFNFTSRPTDLVWFSARFRSYDFDNRTPEFNVGNSINYDQSVVALNASSENIGYTNEDVRRRRLADADDLRARSASATRAKR